MNSITITDPAGVQDDISIDIAPYDDNAPGDGKTHIVNPSMNLHLWVPGMTAQDIVDLARQYGLHVIALCGYKWIAKRNPEKYPACEHCIRIAGELMREDGE